MENGSPLDRITRLERWRDVVDEERGSIMVELAKLSGVPESLSTVNDRLAGIERRMDDILEKLDERPSHAELAEVQLKNKAELKEVERDLKSIRAKSKLSELEVHGPGGFKFKLLSFSGVTIIVALTLIVAVVALLGLWMLSK